MGQWVLNPKQVVLAEPVSTSLVLVLFDKTFTASALAHILLPDSKLTPKDLVVDEQTMPAQFADKALPLMLQALEAAGVAPTSLTARMVGGAQLFNFGGGGGNPLNVGSRNAIVCRALLAKNGVKVDKTNIGGNKTRRVLYFPQMGQLRIVMLGGETLTL
jgi:chemotaxis protein CheD